MKLEIDKNIFWQNTKLKYNLNSKDIQINTQTQYKLNHSKMAKGQNAEKSKMLWRHKYALRDMGNV